MVKIFLVEEPAAAEGEIPMTKEKPTEIQEELVVVEEIPTPKE